MSTPKTPFATPPPENVYFCFRLLDVFGAGFGSGAGVRPGSGRGVEEGDGVSDGVGAGVLSLLLQFHLFKSFNF